MIRPCTVVLLLAALVALCVADDKFPDNDSINLDAILGNDEKLAVQKDCIIQGPCTEEGEAVKNILVDAILNNCAKCTEKQSKGATKGIKFLYAKKPEIWQQIIAKIDPAGDFVKAHPEIFA